MPTVETSGGQVHITGAPATVLTPGDTLLFAQALVEAAARAEGDRMLDEHQRKRASQSPNV